MLELHAEAKPFTGRKHFSWLCRLAALAAVGTATWGWVEYEREQAARRGVVIPKMVFDVGDRSAGLEFPVAVLLRNEGSRRCLVVDLSGGC